VGSWYKLKSEVGSRNAEKENDGYRTPNGDQILENKKYPVIRKAQVEAATLNKGLPMLVGAGFIPAFKTLKGLNWRG
jgi:hypothetical protein